MTLKGFSWMISKGLKVDFESFNSIFSKGLSWTVLKGLNVDFEGFNLMVSKGSFNGFERVVNDFKQRSWLY